MLRDIEMQNLPPVMTDHEETIEHAEGERWDREKIHRGNRLPVIAEESEPSLGWLRISRRLAHPARD